MKKLTPLLGFLDASPQNLRLQLHFHKTNLSMLHDIKYANLGMVSAIWNIMWFGRTKLKRAINELSWCKNYQNWKWLSFLIVMPLTLIDCLTKGKFVYKCSNFGRLTVIVLVSVIVLWVSLSNRMNICSI